MEVGDRVRDRKTKAEGEVVQIAKIPGWVYVAFEGQRLPTLIDGAKLTRLDSSKQT